MDEKEKVEEIEELEVQNTFNEDGLDVLCDSDTIIENETEAE